MHSIRLRGARTHNLRGLDLELFPAQLVAVTGPSGAGKSSLALDTLYAEGQRRFVESFSPYARQFLERLERPPMDELAPIAATIAVDRRAPVKSSRSTLATMADLEPYLAALFAREAIPTCPDCDLEAIDTSPRDAATRLSTTMAGARAIVTYGVFADDAEQFLKLRETLAKDGYRRIVVAGTVREIDDVRPSEAAAPGVRLEVVVDRVGVNPREMRRLQEAIEAAWSRGGGRAELRAEGGAHVSVPRGLVCPKCTRAFDPPRPGLFSYNSPFGACDACRGFGRIIAVDWDRVIPDPAKTLAAGAIKPWSGPSTTWERRVLHKFCAKRKIPLGVSWAKLSAEQRALVIDGEGSWHGGKYPGVRAWFAWLETRVYKMHVRVLLSRYREYTPCAACMGSRLNPIALAYRVGGENLAGWHALTVGEALTRLDEYEARDPQGKRVKEQLASRLGYLDAVGLGYLTLDRQSRTLSGGEAQRAGLTTALGAALTGTLFVLDEPTVGLHVSDVPALAKVMRELSRAGNMVMVVEHEPAIVRGCDRVIEMGPGAGLHGGRILFDGTPAELAERIDLPTGRAWADAAARTAAPRRRAARGWIEVRGARAHNLVGVDAKFPLGVVCALTGPSGSGKSTLAHDVLYRAAARALGDLSVERPGEHDTLNGIRQLQRVVLVDQSPLGRTARGNPATYVKAWDRIRARFAAEPEAVRRGMTPAHFSFNVPGGRCEECAGEGYETVEMQFLADVQLRCAACHGRRFKPEVLAVAHRDRSIADVLAMTVEEALSVFDPQDGRDYVVRRTLDPIIKVGLGYLPLGQPLSTLSGGEAQRLKLARALTEEAPGTLFVVDEPSAGLHGSDTAHVIGALHALADEGASVVVVEHDLDVIRASDWVIDLGPGGGPYGGRIVAEGTPEDVARADTRTGAALRGKMLSRRGAEVGDLGLSSSAPPRPTIPDAIVVSHAREHNLKDVSCRIPHGQILRRHRAERVRQVLAGVRRRLRRGPAPLHGNPHAVRAPVLADAAATGRGRCMGRSAGHRPRATHGPRRGQLHRRDGHRGRPLLAPSLRKGRRASLPGVRRGDHADERRCALRQGGRVPGYRKDDCLRAGSSGPQGDLSRPLHLGVPHRRQGRARRRRHRRDRPAAEADEDERAHDRSHRLLRQARAARSRDVRPRALLGQRCAASGGRNSHRQGQGHRTVPLDRQDLPCVRDRCPGDRPALVLVQHEAGSVPRVRGDRRGRRPRSARRARTAWALQRVRRLAPQPCPQRRAHLRRYLLDDNGPLGRERACTRALLALRRIRP